MIDEPDPYEVLQVRPDAEEDVIRAAYRALARKLHPDHSLEPASAALMVQVNWAWEILSDPERRAAYNELHKNGAEAAGGAQSAEGGTSSTGAGAGAGASQAGTGARGSGFSGGPKVERRTADGRVIEWRTAPDGTGGAGPPPGRPSGSIIPFGRFIAWSIGEIIRYDPGYLEWLDARPEGAPYRDEIHETLTRHGWRQKAGTADQSRRKPR